MNNDIKLLNEISQELKNVQKINTLALFRTLFSQ